MNRMLSLVSLAVLALSTGCASTTMIRSTPSGATIRNMRGEEIGKTPFNYSGNGIIFSSETFTVEKKGYEKAEVKISRDQVNFLVAGGWGVPAVLIMANGGWAGIPLLAGLLWSADYQKNYDVQLKRASKEITPPLKADDAEGDDGDTAPQAPASTTDSDEDDAPVAPQHHAHARAVSIR